MWKKERRKKIKPLIKMKKHIGFLIAGNFYRYNVFEISDAIGNLYYIAEPVGRGVTRGAKSVESLKQILEKDVWALNHIWTR